MPCIAMLAYCHVTNMSCDADAGFMQQFAAVCRPDEPEKNMAKVIEKLSGGKTPTRILCCGHSLGGALATLGRPPVSFH